MSETRRPALHFQRLQIERMPGFERAGFSLNQLAGGINLLYGPNGSGKTTAARAMAYLLWPPTQHFREIVRAKATIHDQPWQIEWSYNQRTVRRAGDPAELPDLPPASSRSRYWLSLHELLIPSESNESLALAIAQESIGGYDLDAAGREIHAEYPSLPQGDARKLQAAIQAIREIDNAQSELAREADQLASLRARQRAATAARQALIGINAVMAWREAREEVTSIESQLESMPVELAAMRGDELERLEKLNTQLTEQGRLIEKLEAQITEAEQHRADADLPEPGISEAILDELDARINGLLELERGKRELERNRAEAQALLDQARADLQGQLDETAVSDVSLRREDWQSLSRAAEHAHEAVRHERAVAAERAAIGEDEPIAQSQLDQLNRGLSLLTDWLASPPPLERSDPSTSGTSAAMLVWIGPGLLILGAILAWFAAGWLSGVLLVFALLAAGGVWFARSQKRADRDLAVETSPHAYLESSFADLSVPQPENWQRETIKQHLDQLLQDQARLRDAQTRGIRRESLSERLNALKSDAADALAALNTAAEQLGLSIELDEVRRDTPWLIQLARRLGECRTARDGLQKLVAAIEQQEQAAAQERSMILATLRRYSPSVMIEDGEQARAAARALRRRADQHGQASRELADLTGPTGRRTTAMQTRDQLAAEVEAIFATVGLSSDEQEALVSLSERFSEFQKIKHAHTQAIAVARSARATMERLTVPEDRERWVELEIVELELEKERLANQAEEAESLATAIGDIQGRLHQARQGHALRDAMIARDRLAEGLSNERDASCDRIVAETLLRHVREQTARLTRPEVLDRAEAIFSTMTRGRYRLRVTENQQGPRFDAYDTTRAVWQELNELSSGRRLQLLIAARLAFIEKQEQALRLPLVLDETLANSDDTSATALIEAMLDEAAAGRQIFYLTAQLDEVSKWQEALAQRPELSHCLLDLTDARRVAAIQATPLPLTSLTATAQTRLTTIPAPDGRDRLAYAEAIGVPGIDPYQPVTAVHLWHIIRDLDRLHPLLEKGITTWGQLESLLERGGDGWLDAAARREARAIAAGIAAGCRAWQIGRGKPLDPEAVEGSDELQRYLDRYRELAEACEWDAERFVREMRDNSGLGSIRQPTRDAIESHLREQGYLSDATPLSRDELRTRILATASSPDDALPSSIVEEIITTICDD